MRSAAWSISWSTNVAPASVGVSAMSVTRVGVQLKLPPPMKAIFMWVILLEALGALALLGLIVWWTMFSGRRHGERHDDE